MRCLVRKAEEKDYEAVWGIMNEVQELHIGLRPDIYRENPDFFPKEYFEGLIEKELAYVAEKDRTVAGILLLMFRHVESPTQVTRNVVYIECMAVKEEYRGQGVGHSFFEKVKEIKEEKGFDGIELQVNAGNRAAMEMYRKCGFTEKSINMELL